MEKKQLFIKWLKIFGIVLGILVALSVIATLIYSAVVKVNPVSAFTSFFKSDKAEIIGIWEDDDFDGATAFVFREDGTYDRYISTANFPGEYTIDGNKIILKNANSELTLTYYFRLAGAHLLPLSPGHLQDPLAPGEHLLVPDQKPLRLHAVVELILVGEGGGEGVLKDPPGVGKEVAGQNGRQKYDDKGDQGSALLHGISLFLPGAARVSGGHRPSSGRSSAPEVRGTGRSGTMVEMACL